MAKPAKPGNRKPRQRDYQREYQARVDRAKREGNRSYAEKRKIRKKMLAEPESDIWSEVGKAQNVLRQRPADGDVAGWKAWRVEYSKLTQLLRGLKYR